MHRVRHGLALRRYRTLDERVTGGPVSLPGRTDYQIWICEERYR